MFIGPTEAAWISKYSAIRQRIAYPKKPAIVMPEIGQKLGGPIRLIFDEDINPHGRRHIYSRRLPAGTVRKRPHVQRHS